MSLSYEQIDELVDLTINKVRRKNYIETPTKSIQSGFDGIREILNDYKTRNKIEISIDSVNNYRDYYVLEGRLHSIVKSLNEFLYDVNRFLQDEQVDKDIEQLKRVLTGEKLES